MASARAWLTRGVNENDAARVEALGAPGDGAAVIAVGGAGHGDAFGGGAVRAGVELGRGGRCGGAPPRASSLSNRFATA